VHQHLSRKTARATLTTSSHRLRRNVGRRDPHARPHREGDTTHRFEPRPAHDFSHVAVHNVREPGAATPEAPVLRRSTPGQPDAVPAAAATGQRCPLRVSGESGAAKAATYRIEEQVPEEQWLISGFDIGSADIDPTKGSIASLATQVVEAIIGGSLIVIFPIEDKLLDVVGYSDCLGGPALNEDLRSRRAANVCTALKAAPDSMTADFFDFQIRACEAAPLDAYPDTNLTSAGRTRNRSIMIRVRAPRTRAPGPSLPFDPTFGPTGENCFSYPLSARFFSQEYANNAFCACTHTPDEPHNNCVRKCLQDKTRRFLAASAADLQQGVIAWCLTIWTFHRDCYRDCGCERPFIDLSLFQIMCDTQFACPAVGVSIAWLNPCVPPASAQ